MRITKLQIENYKGFRDSGPLSLGPNFNVLVGQNNSGKTALLEACQISKCPIQPYKGLNVARGAALNPNRVIRASVSVAGGTLKSALLQKGATIDIPLPASQNRESFATFVGRLLSDDANITLSFSVLNHGGAEPNHYPSHGLFAVEDDHAYARVSPSKDLQDVHISFSAGRNDTLLQLLDWLISDHIYAFRPERLNVGTSRIGDAHLLSPDARNLPAVLFKLQSNFARFERYNEHVRSIFPSIHRVVIVPSENDSVNIQVWTVDPATERDDLLIKLEESGTGVSQVLAILYVAMTRTSNVIAIDEPNSFLHPGAAKKLLQILKQYDQNQYIISTHSPELISIANPDTIHLVQWNGEESVVEQMDRAAISDMQRILSDVGVTLSDVFSADRVVWVEGPTEQECFPKIAATLASGMPLTVSFVPLRNTGDLEAKGVNADLAWEVYERLTNGPSLLPATLAFSFDRENRSEEKVRDIERRSKGRAHFLPRATYENYLLDSDAIQIVLAEECARHNVSEAPTKEQIEAWVETNKSKYTLGDTSNTRPWVTSCDAPKLLSDLFQELTDAKIMYHKLTHSIALTDWLLANKEGQLSELKDYVGGLISTPTPDAA